MKCVALILKGMVEVRVGLLSFLGCYCDIYLDICLMYAWNSLPKLTLYNRVFIGRRISARALMGICRMTKFLVLL